MDIFWNYTKETVHLVQEILKPIQNQPSYDTSRVNAPPKRSDFLLNIVHHHYRKFNNIINLRSGVFFLFSGYNIIGPGQTHINLTSIIQTPLYD